MDSKDLKIFVKVYELSSLSKAADQVYMSIQGVSKVIQKLESEIKVPLFERSSKGMTATHYADTLYAKAQNIIRELDSVYTEIPNGICCTKVRAAFSYGVLPMMGFELISEFQQKMPEIWLDYVEDTDVNIEKAVLNGDIDIAVIGLPMFLEAYKYEYLCSCRHTAVVNQSHPYASRSALLYEDLNHQDLCMIGKNFNPYHHNIQRFTNHHVVPRSITETSEIAYTHLFAAQNKGIGIAVQLNFLADLYSNIKILPFEDKSFCWDIYIITKREHFKTEAEQRVIQFLHTCPALHHFQYQ